MLSGIRLVRHELVWETRCYDFTQADLDHLIREQELCIASNLLTSQYNAQQLLDVIGNMSLHDIITDFQKWNNGEPSIQVLQRRWGGQTSYSEPLGSIIMDYLRDCCSDADVSDNSYADDYEEQLDFIEDAE